MSLSKPEIAIVGAGIIGLSCAWELLRRGANVTVYETHWPPAGASWAAAGMLGAAYEGAHDETPDGSFSRLCFESRALWAKFAEDLEQESGLNVGYRSANTLAVGLDEDELGDLNKVRDRLLDRPGGVRRLMGHDLRRFEPGLAGDIHRGLFLPTDGCVDPRAVLEALYTAFEAAGGVFRIASGKEIMQDKVNAFDARLVTTGSADGDYVQPVKGVMLAFRRADLPLDHVVRCGREYAVPRGDKVLVGATVGEVADARSYLLSRAVRFLPRLRKAALVDQWSGLRPAAPDRLPIMGRIGQSGTYIANGHYRNGILLAPMTAQIMADMILEGEVSELAAPFTQTRFGATA